MLQELHKVMMIVALSKDRLINGGPVAFIVLRDSQACSAAHWLLDPAFLCKGTGDCSGVLCEPCPTVAAEVLQIIIATAVL